MEDKHAYWVPVDCNVAGDSGIRCSNCNFFVSDHTDNIEEYYHCPKCGFIMGEPIQEQYVMDFNEVLQKAIDKQRAETGFIEPECVFIDDTPFTKTEYTQLRESKYLMDNFDVVTDLKRSGLKIADELVPKSVNGYMVRYVLELTPSGFDYQNILNVYVCVSLFCNGAGKPTTFHEKHAFDISDAKRSDGSNNESFYHYVNSRYNSTFEHLLHSVCRFANAQYKEKEK